MMARVPRKSPSSDLSSLLADTGETDELQGEAAPVGQAEAAADELTLGEAGTLANVAPPDARLAPGFAVSDEPPPGFDDDAPQDAQPLPLPPVASTDPNVPPTASAASRHRSYIEHVNALARGSASTPPGAEIARAGSAQGTPHPVQSPALALEGEILPPGTRQQSGSVRYEGRIRILEAYQFAGAVHSAPEWVDRSWVAWGDYDPLRGIEPGPALRVPLASGQAVYCRLGDFVVRQEVLLAPGMASDVRVEVWPRDQFERNFMPVPAAYSEPVPDAPMPRTVPGPDEEIA